MLTISALENDSKRDALRTTYSGVRRTGEGQPVAFRNRNPLRRGLRVAWYGRWCYVYEFMNPDSVGTRYHKRSFMWITRLAYDCDAEHNGATVRYSANPIPNLTLPLILTPSCMRTQHHVSSGGHISHRMSRQKGRQIGRQVSTTSVLKHAMI